MRRLFLILAVYGAINAIAYCCLLPLWEGFDEAYHYGYVQFLSTNLRFPVLGQTSLSREIWHSFQLVPVSHYLQPFTGAPLSFADYFALPEEERRQRRAQLESLAASEKYEPQASKPNYEVNQSPLPYLFMAAIDRALLNRPLPTRVLFLRLACSILAVLLIAHSTLLLCGKLALPDWYAAAALFCVFSSQMLYATIGHVCNDWLAIPLMGYLIWAAIGVWETGARRDCLWLGLAISAALLTKAYLLFLTPLALGWMIWALWRRRANFAGAVCFVVPVLLLAGPWYVRNLLLYRNLSATVESTSGLGLGQFFHAALALPWRESIVYMAHSSLWTGNNSFTTFSAATIDIMLGLVAVSLVMFAMRAKRAVAEWTIVTAVVLFCGGLLVVTVAFYVGSKHGAIAAVPWYMQVLLTPVLLLCFLGMSRAPRWGRILALLFVLVWSYVLAATYLIKLAPLYGGYLTSRTHWRELPAWYLSGQWETILQTVCLVGPTALWVFIGAAIVLSVLLCVKLVASTARRAV
jgi:hypothetical protein